MTINALNAALTALAAAHGAKIIFNGHDLWSILHASIPAAGEAEAIEAALTALAADGEVFIRDTREAFIIRAA